MCVNTDWNSFEAYFSLALFKGLHKIVVSGNFNFTQNSTTPALCRSAPYRTRRAQDAPGAGHRCGTPLRSLRWRCSAGLLEIQLRQNQNETGKEQARKVKAARGGHSVRVHTGRAVSGGRPGAKGPLGRHSLISGLWRRSPRQQVASRSTTTRCPKRCSAATAALLCARPLLLASPSCLRAAPGSPQHPPHLASTRSRPPLPASPPGPLGARTWPGAWWPSPPQRRPPAAISSFPPGRGRSGAERGRGAGPALRKAPAARSGAMAGSGCGNACKRPAEADGTAEGLEAARKRSRTERGGRRKAKVGGRGGEPRVGLRGWGPWRRGFLAGVWPLSLTGWRLCLTSNPGLKLHQHSPGGRLCRN